MLCNIVRNMQKPAAPLGFAPTSTAILDHPSKGPALIMLHISHSNESMARQTLKATNFLNTIGLLHMDVYPRNETNPVAAVNIMRSGKKMT